MLEKMLEGDIYIPSSNQLGFYHDRWYLYFVMEIL